MDPCPHCHKKARVLRIDFVYAYREIKFDKEGEYLSERYVPRDFYGCEYRCENCNQLRDDIIPSIDGRSVEDRYDN